MWLSFSKPWSSASQPLSNYGYIWLSNLKIHIENLLFAFKRHWWKWSLTCCILWYKFLLFWLNCGFSLCQREFHPPEALVSLWKQWSNLSFWSFSNCHPSWCAGGEQGELTIKWTGEESSRYSAGKDVAFGSILELFLRSPKTYRNKFNNLKSKNIFYSVEHKWPYLYPGLINMDVCENNIAPSLSNRKLKRRCFRFSAEGQ